MEQHEFMFILTTVFLEDERTGHITAFFAQFPQASAEGRDKDEAKKMLYEIFPVMLEDKADQFKKEFHSIAVRDVTYEQQTVYA